MNNVVSLEVVNFNSIVFTIYTGYKALKKNIYNSHTIAITALFRMQVECMGRGQVVRTTDSRSMGLGFDCHCRLV